MNIITIYKIISIETDSPWTACENTSLSQSLTRANKDKMKNGASNYMDGRFSKASTPPSSCQELSMLDHYLDGLYLVKNEETNKIESVFCQFLADNQGKINLISGSQNWR